MLVDDENKFLTGRQEPTLTLLNVKYNEEGNFLEITSKNPEMPMDTLKIDLGLASSTPRETLQLSYVSVPVFRCNFEAGYLL